MKYNRKLQIVFFIDISEYTCTKGYGVRGDVDLHMLLFNEIASIHVTSITLIDTSIQCVSNNLNIL